MLCPPCLNLNDSDSRPSSLSLSPLINFDVFDVNLRGGGYPCAPERGDRNMLVITFPSLCCLVISLYALLGKEGDVFRDEGVIEGIEVESRSDLLLAVSERGGNC